MITYTQSNLLLAHIFGKTTYTAPSTLYIGLSTQDPGVTGNNIAEPSVSGTNYSRIAYTNNSQSSDWTVPASGITSNVNTIQFGKSSASWGIITYFFIADAANGGNVLYYEALSTPITVETNTTVQFLAGDLSVSMNNG